MVDGACKISSINQSIEHNNCGAYSLRVVAYRLRSLGVFHHLLALCKIRFYHDVGGGNSLKLRTILYKTSTVVRRPKITLSSGSIHTPGVRCGVYIAIQKVALALGLVLVINLQHCWVLPHRRYALNRPLLL